MSSSAVRVISIGVHLTVLGLVASVDAQPDPEEGAELAPEADEPISLRPFVHVVRPSETLASIAQRYYGDPRRERILVAENGLTAQGGAAIVVGLRLAIPFVSYHQVSEDETWDQLAERFYGSAERAFLLVDANDGSMGDQPDIGAELIVPYPLRHTAEQNETLRTIAEGYYGSDGSTEIRLLRRFNDMRGLRPARGQVVLVPMSDLTLTDEGRARVAAEGGVDVGAGEVRQLQQRIDAELPVLREHIHRGRFAEAVSLGNRLLGAGPLTGNQTLTVQRELGTAYVALERRDLAIAAFREALSLQPDLELDSSRTSPTVLDAFRAARSQGPTGAEGATDPVEPQAPDPAGTQR